MQRTNSEKVKIKVSITILKKLINGNLNRTLNECILKLDLNLSLPKHSGLTKSESTVINDHNTEIETLFFKISIIAIPSNIIAVKCLHRSQLKP